MDYPISNFDNRIISQHKPEGLMAAVFKDIDPFADQTVFDPFYVAYVCPVHYD